MAANVEMDEQIIETFCDEIRESIFDIAKELLNTENFDVHIEQLFKEGKSPKFHDNTVGCVKFNSSSDNFIASIYRVRLSTTDGSQTASLFFKMAPDNQLKRSLLQIHDTFVREAFVYEVVKCHHLFMWTQISDIDTVLMGDSGKCKHLQVLPYFRDFQHLKRVHKDGFSEYPICYKSITTEPIETMFFEDMTQADFTMVDKDEITSEHILLTMKALGKYSNVESMVPCDFMQNNKRILLFWIGKFHAISLALKDQEPEKFAEILSGLNEIFFVSGAESIFADQM